MSHTKPKPSGPVVAGVVGFFDTPKTLTKATQATRDAKWERFDAYSPFPVHGLEHAQGIQRSWLPYITIIFGLAGFCCAFGLEYWTSAVSWPINIGGKPFNSWPAFVPVMFELTILLAALSTVAFMLIANGLPNITKRAFDPGITRDRFAVLIESVAESDDEEVQEKREKRRNSKGLKKFNADEATQFLKSLGAKDVKTVYAEGWF